MTINRFVNEIIDQHKTRNPFQIASNLGYIIIYYPLVQTRGFYQQIHNCDIIYINSFLNDHEKKFVCAHELGHSLLHNGLNRIFMDTGTFIINSKYEKESNKFAVDLLFDDYDIKPYLEMPISAAASFMGTTEDIAEYRIKNINTRILP